MAIDTTDHVLNSTQSGLSSVCHLMGIFGAWQQQYLTPTTFVLFVFTASAEALICPFTILLNASVILVVKRKRFLRKQKSNVLLACLAATDLSAGAVALPLVITSHVLRILGVGPICLMDAITLIIMGIICGASFFHLVIISGERYIGIKHALRYQTLVTTRRLTAAVSAAWAVSVALNLIFFAFEQAGESLLVYHFLLIFFFSGVLAVSFCQVAVLLENRRHRKHIKAHQVSGSSAKELLKKDKAAKTTTIVVGALCLCFAPQIVFSEVAAASNFPASIAIAVTNVLNIFLYSNSLINPIIYCVRTEEFRRAFKELFNLETSQTNANFAVNTVRRSRGQQEEGKACIDSSHSKKQTAWPDPAHSRGSRSRSLDLSKDSTHKPSRSRTNSL